MRKETDQAPHPTSDFKEAVWSFNETWRWETRLRWDLAWTFARFGREYERRRAANLLEALRVGLKGIEHAEAERLMGLIDSHKDDQVR